MKFPNFNEEKRLWKQGYKWVIGLDESGRGPLAGPVVASAVSISQFQISNFKFQINDSKKLNPKKREEAYKILINHPNISWGIGIVSEKVIDKINILEATKLAMLKSIENLEKNIRKKKYHKTDGHQIYSTFFSTDFLLIDGNFKLLQGPTSQILRGRTLFDLNIGEKSIIKGDQKVFSISAASIIAKVTRDKIMQKMHKKYPHYGFKNNKGYGTDFHIKSLNNFGPCAIHRKSFYPISILS